MDIPLVTVPQMREIDRIAVESGISVLMMMENVSRNIASLARTILKGLVKDKNILVLCGKGNNSGGGLGSARHLINFGANVSCFLTTKPEQLSDAAKTQYQILKNTKANLFEFSEENLAQKLLDTDLIIDALLGYNLKGDPKESIATYIRLANQSQKPILAVDLPSGLSGDTGKAFNPTIKAFATLTLALPKVGLLTEEAKEYVGKLYLGDLSIPKIVYQKIGIEVPLLFEKENTVKIY